MELKHLIHLISLSPNLLQQSDGEVFTVFDLVNDLLICLYQC